MRVLGGRSVASGRGVWIDAAVFMRQAWDILKSQFATSNIREDREDREEMVC